MKTIYSSNLNPSQPNITERFTNAVGFFINAPFLNAELEIDCFLQVYFSFTSEEKIRNYPLGKITEQAILLNVTDTESLVSIPQEFLDTDLEMSLLFLASDNTYLEVYVIEKYSLETKLNQIDNKLNLILANLNIPVPVSSVANFDQSDFAFFNLLGFI